MNKEVYKVVYEDPETKLLVSAYIHGIKNSCNLLTRTYEIGKTTIPHPGTKLFVFTSLSEAFYYRKIIRDFSKYKVFSALATEIEENGWFQFLEMDIDRLIKRFKNREFEEADKWLKSSSVCSSITLIEELND
jgi:hypothetical protein